MRKVFIVDIEGGISEMELLGCLEDTIGEGVNSVKSVDMPFCVKCGTIKQVHYSDFKPICDTCKYKLKKED